MSRIADAHARAGVALPGENAAVWDAEREAAVAYLGDAIGRAKPAEGAPVPAAPAVGREAKMDRSPGWQAVANDLDLREAPAPAVEPRERRARRSSVSSETIEFELASAVRRMFLSSGSALRSVLFCTTPGDRMQDVAWQAAELLAAQSGRRVAFVEDTANSVAPPGSNAGHSLITRIGWYPQEQSAWDSPARGAKESGARHASPDADDVLGAHVADLFASFDFVIINATAPVAADLVPLANEVEGVILLLTEDETRLDAAEVLVTTLRDGGARWLGAMLTSSAPGTADSMFRLHG